MLSKQEALRLIDGRSKAKHMIAVSAIMKGLAKRLGMNEEEWELVGLLHDLDHDEVKGDMSKHGLVAAKMLKGRLSEECLYAIRAHDHRTGVKPKSVLDKALIASDIVSIFVVAAASVMPDKKISRISVGTLKEKFRDKSFIKGAQRNRFDPRRIL